MAAGLLWKDHSVHQLLEANHWWGFRRAYHCCAVAVGLAKDDGLVGGQQIAGCVVFVFVSVWCGTGVDRWECCLISTEMVDLAIVGGTSVKLNGGGGVDQYSYANN